MLDSSITQKYSGFVIGLGVVASLFYPLLFILPALAILITTRSRYSNLRFFLLVVPMLLMAWVVTKSLLIGNLGYATLITVFPLFMIAALSTRVIPRSMLDGVCLAVTILFAVDMVFNLYSIWFGVDLLGRVPSFREDGTRYGGVMGHSFFSIAISSCFMLLALLLNRNRFYLLVGLANFLLSGSMRIYIYLFCFFIFVIFLNKKKWSTQVISVVLVVLLVVSVTVLSVMQGWVSERSGNSFRIFAWQNALSVIPESPILGSWEHFEAWGDDRGVTEESLIDTGTTESALLTDALFWGLFYVVGKLSILFVLGKHFNMYTHKGILLNENKVFSFLVFVIIADYFIGSLWGGMLVAFITTLIIVYGISLVEAKNRIRAQEHSYHVSHPHNVG